MSIRRITIAALAASTLFSGAAVAGDYGKKHFVYPSAPTTSYNSVQANNVAAGKKNQAYQGVIAQQQGPSGWGYHPSVGVNQATANNVAAGYKNQASQQVGVMQKNGSGAFSFNSATANNTAAGIGNFAGQSVFVDQK